MNRRVTSSSSASDMEDNPLIRHFLSDTEELRDAGLDIRHPRRRQEKAKDAAVAGSQVEEARSPRGVIKDEDQKVSVK